MNAHADDVAEPFIDAAVQTATDLQDRVVQGSKWTAIYVVTSLPLNIAATAVVARLLGAAGYGEFAYLTTLFAIVASVSDLGYTAAAVQWASAARAKSDQATHRAFVARVTGFHVFVQGPLMFLASLVILRDKGVAVAAGFGVISWAFLWVSGSTLLLVLEQRSDMLAKLSAATNIITQVGSILCAVWWRDAVALVVFRGVAAALPALFALPTLGAAGRWVVLAPRHPLVVSKQFVRFAAASVSLGVVAMLVYSRSEVLLLQHLSTAENVALFGLAFGISTQLTGPVDAMIAPLIPAATAIVTAHQDRAVQMLARAVRMASLLSGLLVSAALPAVVALMPLIYGNEFAETALMVLALGVTSALTSAFRPVGIILTANRRPGVLLAANLGGLAVDVVLAVLLIPTWGAWGAVVCNAAGQVVALSWTCQQTRHIYDMSWRQFLGLGSGFAVASVAGGAAGTAAWWIVPSLSPVPAAVLGAFAGLALHAVLARSTRVGVLPRERDLLVAALPGAVAPVLRRVLDAGFVRVPTRGGAV